MDEKFRRLLLSSPHAYRIHQSYVGKELEEELLAMTLCFYELFCKTNDKYIKEVLASPPQIIVSASKYAMIREKNGRVGGET